MTTALRTASNDQRAQDVVAALNGWNKGLRASDRAAKYEKMAENSFIFFRGTNHLFWSDFSHNARLREFGDSRTRTWLQGDLHVENFGAFSNDRGVVVYDVNDFDESVIADYQFDVWRMAISIVLANEALARDDVEAVINTFCAAYLDSVIGFCADGGEHEVVLTAETARGRLDNFLRKVEKKNSRRDMLEAWTGLSGAFKSTEHEDLVAVEPALRDQLIAAIGRYARDTLAEEPEGMHANYFTVRDVARRVGAGTGSLGVPRFYALIHGKDDAFDTDCILDIKLQTKPTAYYFLGEEDQRAYRFFTENKPGQDAIWHAAAYRAMMKGTDDHLGWLKLGDDFFSVRERSFVKKTLKIDALDSKRRFESMAEQWAATLAAIHARALTDFDDDFPNADLRQRFFREMHGKKSFKCRVAKRCEGRIKPFSALVTDIAFTYAAQVARDHAHFIEADLAPIDHATSADPV